MDTMKDIYEISLYTKVLFFQDNEKIGLSAKWDGKLIPSSMELKLPFKKTVVVSGVPITFDNFRVGVEHFDITKWMEITLVGKMDASAYSLKSLVPKVAEYIGDLSLLKLENSTLRLNYVKMEAETTAKILEMCIRDRAWAARWMRIISRPSPRAPAAPTSM